VWHELAALIELLGAVAATALWASQQRYDLFEISQNSLYCCQAMPQWPFV
jgi:hypothetical protein